MKESSTSSCVYKLSVGSSIDGYPTGGTFRISVSTRPSTRCSWTAVSDAAWMHVTNDASGSGSGAFTLVVDANPGSARIGTLAAAGQIIVFNQSSEGT